MRYQTQYGEDTCNSTCGVPYTPTTYTPSTPTTTSFKPTTTPSLENKTCEEKDVVYEGNLIQELENTPTWEQCAESCYAKKDLCEHFSWTPEEKCALKNQIEEKKDQSGTISGTAECGKGKSSSKKLV